MESRHSVQSTSVSYGGIGEIQKDVPNSRHRQIDVEYPVPADVFRYISTEDRSQTHPDAEYGTEHALHPGSFGRFVEVGHRRGGHRYQDPSSETLQGAACDHHLHAGGHARQQGPLQRTVPVRRGIPVSSRTGRKVFQRWGSSRSRTAYMP